MCNFMKYKSKKENEYSVFLILLGIFLLANLFWGCTDVENLTKFSTSNSVTNKDALRFLHSLNSQPEQLGIYEGLLAGKQPLYNSVKLCNGSKYGMYYFIPYAQLGSKEVEGAIYYPVEYEIGEDNIVKLKNNLHSPENINAEIINNDIPITSRYIYSHAFTRLADEGLRINKNLSNYEFLHDSVLTIEGINRPKTRFFYPNNEDYIEIEIFYFSEYVGDKIDAIYALSANAMVRFAEKSLNSLNLYRRYDLRHDFSRLLITIPLEELRASGNCRNGGYDAYNSFIQQCVYRIESYGDDLDFKIFLQWNYRIYEYDQFIEGDEDGISNISDRTSGGGGYSGPFDMAPTIFNVDGLSEEESQRLEELMNEMVKNCLGGNLYDGLRKVLKGKHIKIYANTDPTLNGSFQFGEYGVKFTFSFKAGSNKLFHEMFHMYQAYQETNASYVASGLNLEIEAHYAEYLYLKNQPDNKDTQWSEIYNYGRHKTIQDLESYIDKYGNLLSKESDAKEKLNEYLHNVVIPAFRKNGYDDNNLNKYNENRVGDDNFSNLKVLMKGCK